MTIHQRVGDLEILSFETGVVRTNCYVAYHRDHREAVIVDPGDGARHKLRELLREHRLAPRAVAVTHGHLDHVWSAQRFADSHGIPVHVHRDDRAMLRNPLRGVVPRIGQRLVGALCSEPEQVVELTGGDRVEVAGLVFDVDHTPGHTPGSISLKLSGDDHPDIVFTGDTLFNGTVGRTDLGGGSGNQLLGSIISKLLVLDDRAMILPGHGPQTTIGVERQANPFLR